VRGWFRARCICAPASMGSGRQEQIVSRTFQRHVTGSGTRLLPQHHTTVGQYGQSQPGIGARRHGNVPYSTLHYRARGRPLMEEKARGQHYLKPYKEDVGIDRLGVFGVGIRKMNRNFNTFEDLKPLERASCSRY
jgi:hypothetical protein